MNYMSCTFTFDELDFAKGEGLKEPLTNDQLKFLLNNIKEILRDICKKHIANTSYRLNSIKMEIKYIQRRKISIQGSFELYIRDGNKCNSIYIIFDGSTRDFFNNPDRTDIEFFIRVNDFYNCYSIDDHDNIPLYKIVEEIGYDEQKILKSYYQYDCEDGEKIERFEFQKFDIAKEFPY